MGQINIGTPIDINLIRCCSCHKGYEIKGNIYEDNILICPHCGLKHKVDFKIFNKKIENLKKINKLNLTAIDVGSAAIDRASGLVGGSTYILVDNPANLTGKITSLEIYLNTNPVTTPIIAIFTQVSPNVFTVRDHVHLANIPGDQKVVRTVDIDSNPISLNVVAGDFIGFYHVTGGNWQTDLSGSGMWSLAGDQTGCVDTTFTFTNNRTISLYGTGETDVGGDFEYGGNGSLAFSGAGIYVFGLSYIAQTGKWSGLEMCYEDIHKEDYEINAHLDQLVAAGFTQIRLYQPDWSNAYDIGRIKAVSLLIIAKGLKVVTGLTSDVTELTSTNWSDYVTAMQSFATWAQANGVHEVQLGNHLEFYVDGITLTVAQLRINIKALATSIQSIFTNGDVSYSTTVDLAGNLAAWIALGYGDLDSIGWMIYLNSGTGTSWMTNIDAIYAEWGAKSYIVEWNLDAAGYEYYSEDEEVQAAVITEMVNYIKASGIPRAFFYVYSQMGESDSEWAALKNDDTYRLLWWSLLDSGGASLTFSGSATQSYGYNFNTAGTGGLVFSGSAIQSYGYNFNTVGSGSFDFSGTAIQTYTLTIDIGSPAIERINYAAGATVIPKANPANASGNITAIEIFAHNDIPSVLIGIFYRPDPDNYPNNLSTRDYCTLANLSAGYNKITVDSESNPIFLNVLKGDFLGIWLTTTSQLDVDLSGEGRWVYTQNKIPCTNFEFTSGDDRTYSLYGTGVSEGEFVYIGSGSLTFSGTAVQSHTRYYLYTGTGTLLFSGSATQSYGYNFNTVAEGSFAFSGSATYVLGLAYTGSGSFDFSSAGTYILGFAYTASGSLAFSGTATAYVDTRHYVTSASGSVGFSGAASYILGFAYTATGSFGYSGAAITTIGFSCSGNGSLDFSGTATQLHSKCYLYTGAGTSFVYSGSAAQIHGYNFNTNGFGSFNYSGSAIYYKELGYIATGSFTFSGQATQSYTWNYSCVASGGLNLSGVGTCLFGLSYVAGGSLAFSGEGTCSFELSYIANGSGDFHFSGSAFCSYDTEIPAEHFIYAGQGSFTYSGTAGQTYTRNYLYSGSGELIYSGSAGVEKFNFLFTGSGILVFAGEARTLYCYSYLKVNKGVSNYTKINKEISKYHKVNKGC